MIGVFGMLLACSQGAIHPDPELAFWQNRRKLVKESDLFQVFQKQKDHFEIFQLVCEQTGTPIASRCSYRSGPLTSPKSTTSIKMSAQDSDKLFNLLINLPVHKGETGASVDYLGCRRFKNSDKDPYTHYCTIAAPVGLIPHTSLPISEMPDEL